MFFLKGVLRFLISLIFLENSLKTCVFYPQPMSYFTGKDRDQILFGMGLKNLKTSFWIKITCTGIYYWTVTSYKNFTSPRLRFQFPGHFLRQTSPQNTFCTIPIFTMFFFLLFTTFFLPFMTLLWFFCFHSFFVILSPFKL